MRIGTPELPETPDWGGASLSPRSFTIQPDFSLEAGPSHTSSQRSNMRDALAGDFAGAAPDRRWRCSISFEGSKARILACDPITRQLYCF